MSKVHEGRYVLECRTNGWHVVDGDSGKPEHEEAFETQQEAVEFRRSLIMAHQQWLTQQANVFKTVFGE